MNEQDEKNKIELAAIEAIAKYAGICYTVSRGHVVVKRSYDAAMICGMCVQIGISAAYREVDFSVGDSKTYLIYTTK